MGRDAGHGLDRRRMGEISLTLSWIDSAMQGYPVFSGTPSILLFSLVWMEGWLLMEIALHPRNILISLAPSVAGGLVHEKVVCCECVCSCCYCSGTESVFMASSRSLRRN
jgi:hypothetical protein